MKKRNVKSLKLNKKPISNFNLASVFGGSGNACETAESKIICEEPAETVGCGVETFRTYCPCQI
ncbi:hypothetical protein U8527_08760 [Kordia algicida OT-1]|uniref:Uncharacterized protein n=1 Tax=Kordia algicida OT-1 TaxID=391587 RepID=A9CUE7_9FLAO|nr:hypothetical protein [Kordia algicida]EDP94120.1 hypothetical protein KAOT1_02201 [Kordia algicida OT-1]